MSLFRLDASIRGEGSHGRAIADLVEQEWRNAHPDEPIIRILADVWQLDLRVVEAEFTQVGVNPALDGFNDLAHRLRRETELHDHQRGQELAAVTAQRRPPE